jgi:hypothetical protein
VTAVSRESIAQSLADLAAAHGDIDAAWHRFSAMSREERVAADVAAMEGQAEKVNAELGREDGYAYEGGPVRWDADDDGDEW